METYIDIVAHIIFSLLAGFIAWMLFAKGNKKWLTIALIFALISGVVIDIDHLFDYFLAVGPSFAYNLFINRQTYLQTGKMYILLHAFEYVAVLIFLTLYAKNKKTKMIITALMLGLLFHLLTDIVLFSLPFTTYFITYRIITNFNDAF